MLSLWTQRGLDDAALARMTGLDAATITRRRLRIASALSVELGLPPQDVAAALTAIADSAAEAVAGSPDASQAGNGGPARAGPVPSAAKPEAEVQALTHQPELRPEPEPGPVAGRTRRRSGIWPVVTLLGIAVIAIIAITAASGGGSGHPKQSAASAVSASTPAAATGHGTLGPLPGGIAGASGSIVLAAGPAGTQRLRVRVAGLPAAGRDHYEVWLYNSIIDSVALGRLGPGGTGSFTLPAVVTRFASIDISRQLRGTTEPSGASVLRAANPLVGAPH
ncbi:MAG: hypothetical protein M3022_04900 [Actinomycetota bacterium]|nr:hypothetical protein [Actinomycetota bacterium]